jgi:hypothetical protein
MSRCLYNLLGLGEFILKSVSLPMPYFKGFTRLFVGPFSRSAVFVLLLQPTDFTFMPFLAVDADRKAVLTFKLVHHFTSFSRSIGC